MAKTRYHFNTETLSFDKVETTLRKRLKRWIQKFISSVSLALVLVFLFFTFIDSPKEKALKRENEEILSQYHLLSNEVERLDQILQDLEQRDDNIYRVIFEAEPIATSIRRAGTGGVNRYEHLKHLSNSNLIIETTKKIDELSKAIYIQSKSYDQVETLVKNKVEMLACIPAILPVSLTERTTRQITSSFGKRIHPIYKTLKFHAGMDFSGKTGTPIYATGNGVVKACKFEKGYGRHVIIDHGFNYTTLYAHLNEYIVKPGQKVKRGEIIGYLGNTGLSKGAHLHYEVRVKNNPVNPINYYFNDLTPEEFDAFVEAANNTGESMD